MYHRIVTAACPVPDRDPEETRYAVSGDAFERQLDVLAETGRRGVSMQEIHDRLESGQAVPGDWVGITFDDGNRSDVLVAAPALRAHGFSATFYVCGARVGAEGGLDAGEVRRLVEEGFHVGSHGMTHRFLSALSAPDEAGELSRSRLLLEEITGRVVDHFAPPGGRYGGRTLRTLTGLGYRAVATSDFGFNRCVGARMVYRRIPVSGATTDAVFLRIVEGRAPALWKQYVRHAVLRSARGALGERRYARLRRMGIRW